MRSTGRISFLLTPILLGLVACASGPSVTALPAASASAAPNQVSRSLTLQLNPVGDHTAKGTVVIDITADGYTMTVNVTGLVPNSRHLLNTHSGSCARPILEAGDFRNLKDVQADANGAATYTTPLYPRAYTVPSGGRILTVHNEPLEALPGETPVPTGHIGCADLTD